METGIYTTGNNAMKEIYWGELEIEDFNTSIPNKRRAKNQKKATNRYEELKRKAENKKKYSHYTLEELKEMKLISNTTGRPSSTLTDEKWQKEFEIRKMFVKPYPKTVTKLGGKYSRESGMWNEETMGTYHGRTQWQNYVAYINDVLTNIRAGQVDFCYFVYQVMQLACFDFGNKELKTKYCNGYWEVWLDCKEM